MTILKRTILCLWLAVFISFTGCASGRHEQAQGHLECTNPIDCRASEFCRQQVDPVSYGYYPTCWNAWPEEASRCGPPEAEVPSVDVLVEPLEASVYQGEM